MGAKLGRSVLRPYTIGRGHVVLLAQRSGTVALLRVEIFRFTGVHRISPKDFGE